MLFTNSDTQISPISTETQRINETSYFYRSDHFKTGESRWFSFFVYRAFGNFGPGPKFSHFCGFLSEIFGQKIDFSKFSLKNDQIEKFLNAL